MIKYFELDNGYEQITIPINQDNNLRSLGLNFDLDKSEFISPVPDLFKIKLSDMNEIDDICFNYLGYSFQFYSVRYSKFMINFFLNNRKYYHELIGCEDLNLLGSNVVKNGNYFYDFRIKIDCDFRKNYSLNIVFKKVKSKKVLLHSIVTDEKKSVYPVNIFLFNSNQDSLEFLKKLAIDYSESNVDKGDIKALSNLDKLLDLFN